MYLGELYDIATAWPHIEIRQNMYWVYLPANQTLTLMRMPQNVDDHGAYWAYQVDLERDTRRKWIEHLEKKEWYDGLMHERLVLAWDLVDRLSEYGG